MGDPIFSSDVEYSLETSDVENFRELDVFSICCRGLTTIERMEIHIAWYTTTLVFVSGGMISINVVTQSSKGS